MGNIDNKDLDRFKSYVEVNKDNGCWEWNGTLRKGYGRFYLKGSWLTSHRVSWMIYKGPIPKNLLVLHKCDNPCCTNPEHLFLGTQRDNVLDMVNKKRNKILRGSSNPSAKLTESEVVKIRDFYADGGTSYVKLAREFKVSAKLVELIVKNVIWRTA